MRKSPCRSLLVACMLTLYIIGSLGLSPRAAEAAGWLDRVKEIYRLPDDMEQIQKDYAAAKQQLEEQKDKLAEAVSRSQAMEQKLIAQNEALVKENEQLQQRLQAMEQLARDKEQRTRKMTYMASTAAGLVVLYFVLGRVFRLILWRRRGKKPE